MLPSRKAIGEGSRSACARQVKRSRLAVAVDRVRSGSGAGLWLVLRSMGDGRWRGPSSRGRRWMMRPTTSRRSTEACCCVSEGPGVCLGSLARERHRRQTGLASGSSGAAAAASVAAAAAGGGGGVLER
ncbi:hypothetical protein AXG93_1299s1100 [Marchantia polymorpha subsp. ruderalis]|nr:hypothetical protein AXG93_1299s1100 [Marchantia polymorpha subsp. ruderalis]